MSITIVAGLLRTGEILTTVPTTQDGATWSMALNQAGTVTATVPLRELTDQRRIGLLGAVEPWRCYLAAITDTGRVLEAGPIQPHDYDDTTGHLTLRAPGLWSLWAHRNVLHPTLSRVDLTYSGLSLGTIAKRLVENAMDHEGGSLPMVLPPDIAGTYSMTYPWWDLGNKLDARLQELMQTDRGPDISFEPRLRTDGRFIEWVMRTGTPTNPLLQQVGADWQWDRGAARGPLRLLSVNRDPSKMANRQWITGDGMEDAMPVGFAQDLTDTAQGMPLLEDVNRLSATDEPSLDALATANLSSSLRPWQTWSMATSQTQPEVGLYRPGDWATVHIPDGHIYLGAGEYRTRILEVSGGLQDKVGLKLAPTIEHR